MSLQPLSRVSKFICLFFAFAMCLALSACSRSVTVVEQPGLMLEVTAAPHNEIQSVMSNVYTTSEAPTDPPTEMQTVANNKANCIGLTEANLPKGAKVVYLTFDDGPSRNTQRILDVLDNYGCGATFFVMNSTYKIEYKNIVDHGHAIGLHTYSHVFSDLYKSSENYFDDLDRISDLVYNQTGVRSKLIRFPGGSSNTISSDICTGIMTELSDAVEERGYTYFDWNVDSDDARANNVPADDIYAASIDHDYNNLVVLMHDTDAKDTTVEALPRIIEYYRDKGYYFLSLNKNSPTAHHGIYN